jgi:hypothetical protein
VYQLLGNVLLHREVDLVFDPTGGYPHEHVQPSSFKRDEMNTAPALDTTSTNERAIFVISMGAQASNSSLVERFTFSARTTGQYNGWIIILTDAAEGRYDNLQTYPFSQKASKVVESRLVVINPNAKYYPTTSFANKDMAFKRMKTHILDILDEDRRFDDVGIVYYLDVDNVFASSAMNMFQELELTYRIGSEDSGHPRIFFFEGEQKKGRGGPLMKFQGGQFILERKRSEPCLENWRYWIDQDPDEPLDQIALLKMHKEYSQHTSNMADQKNLPGSDLCAMVAMSRAGSTHDHIAFPSRKDIQWAAKHHKLIHSGEARKASDREQYPTLIHIKNTGNALEKTGADDMELYLRNVLNLTDTPPEEDILGITKKISRIQASETDLKTATRV